MRCVQCNKFVSYEEADPEVSLEVDEGGHVTAEVRITNNCAECSSEMAEANFTPEADHTDEIVQHRKEKGEEPDAEETQHELSIEEVSSERTQPDLQTKPKVRCPDCKGKEPKVKTCKTCSGSGQVEKRIPARFRQTFYGFTTEYRITCSCGDLQIDGNLEDAVQASGMDEIQ